MNKTHTTLFALLTSLALLLLSPDDAYAKRLGGGKSFGGRPSYSQSYRPGPDAAPSARAPQSAYQPVPQRNQGLRENFRNRGGLMGMLGGLALGGLLGAMLFGGGFEHINLFDIAVLGLAAYLLYRLFAARRRATWSPLAVGTSRPGHQTDDRSGALPPESAYAGRPDRSRGRFDTNVMFREKASDSSGAISARMALPLGFDEQSFLERAKNAFAHLQTVWNEGDAAELKALTTPSVFDELHRQMLQRGNTGKTRVMSLEARVVNFEADSASAAVSVLFDAILEEDEVTAATPVREVWHFVRQNDSRQPTWYLDGIQQVEG